MLTGDTIVAVSSAPPPAERVVIRLSGPASVGVARAMCTHWQEGRGAWLAGWRAGGGEGGVEVPATLAVFPKPGSYTGEDVVEIGLPGSPWVITTVMESLLRQPGVRHAEAGEFTARAFLMGKLDLTAAEGVAAAVSAGDQRQLKAARQLLSGTLAHETRAMVEKLASLLALLEAGIDFTEEDITFISPDHLKQGIDSLMETTEDLLARGRVFGRVAVLPTVALVGVPNAGKSTLLNRLTGKARAVTSDTAGTTRDAIAEEVMLARGRVRLIDTAGLEDRSKSGEGVLGEIESSMQHRTRTAAETADVLVEVRAIDHAEGAWPLVRRPDLRVVTKSDLGEVWGGGGGEADGSVAVSALTGAGIEELRRRLDGLCFGEGGGEGLALTSRHLLHLHDALAGLGRARSAMGLGDELAAAGLREALDALGRITGEVSSDDVLGRVFATFCIGK